MLTVAGQYLGFIALVVVSLLGAVALRSVSENLVGLLGVVPAVEVQFDPTKRERINTAVLEELLAERDPQTTRVA